MNAVSAEQVWEVLRAIPDPEIPVISICDLGIVREVQADPTGVDVTVTPTYSGCPATEVIESSIRTGLQDAGAEDVRVHRRLSPAWTTDWLAPAAAERLKEYGIAPPGPAEPSAARRVHFAPPCPRCGSRQTQRLSAFGATACKALYRCGACLEPFEYFKPL